MWTCLCDQKRRKCFFIDFLWSWLDRCSKVKVKTYFCPYLSIYHVPYFLKKNYLPIPVPCRDFVTSCSHWRVNKGSGSKWSSSLGAKIIIFIKPRHYETEILLYWKALFVCRWPITSIFNFVLKYYRPLI